MPDFSQKTLPTPRGEKNGEITNGKNQKKTEPPKRLCSVATTNLEC